MISIGAIMGGPELEGSVIDLTVLELMRAIKSLRAENSPASSPSINVVYHVAGSVLGVDFDEMRDGKYSSREKKLMIQIPVSSTEGSREYWEDFLVQSLHGANAFAFHYFEKRKLAYPLADAETIVAEAADCLRSCGRNQG